MFQDESAVILLVFFLSILQAVFFLSQSVVVKKYGGNLLFALSHVLTGFGLVLYLTRQYGLPAFISVILANTLLILSGIGFLFGIRRFLAAKVNYLFPACIFVVFEVVFLVFTFIREDTRIRSIMFSAAAATLILLSAVSLITKSQASIKNPAKAVGLILLVFSAVHFLRAGMLTFVLIFPGLWISQQFDIASFYALMAFSLLWTYSVILMSNQRLVAENREAEEHFQQIFALSPDISIISNAKDAKIIAVNDEFLKQTGYSREEVIGRSSIDISYWADAKDRETVINRILDTGSCDKYLAEFMRKDKSVFSALFSARMISLNGIPHLVSVSHDITDRIMLEKEIYNEKELLRTTLLSIGDGVISTDAEGRVGLMNPVAEDLTGWLQMEASGMPIDTVFHIVNEKTRLACENPVEMALREGHPVSIDDEAILIAKDGVERAVQDSAAPIRDKEDNIIGAVIVFRDCTEAKSRNEHIAYLSYHDQLTGLYNRRFFREELNRLDTERNLPLTLVMADINGLKMANDAFGHRLGDLIITSTADILRSEFRKEDIVSRIGGDEFVAILPHTDSITAEKIVDDIYRKVEGQKVESVLLSVSFGFQTKTDLKEPIADIFKKAEDRMYRKKLSESRSTRNRTLNVILSTLYEKNEYEKKHAERVSKMCANVGKAMGLSEENIQELRTLGLLHDIGKIAVDDATLNAPRILSGKERADLERHAEAGYRILNSIEELSQLALSVMAHHENWDGSGYPKGLKGQDIPQYARVVAIAEAFDEMIHDRPYRGALSKESARSEIDRNTGHKFDPDITRIFLALCDADTLCPADSTNEESLLGTVYKEKE